MKGLSVSLPDDDTAGLADRMSAADAAEDAPAGGPELPRGSIT